MKDVNSISWQKDYNSATNKLRDFFLGEGYIEISGQDHLSILAACEDPKTVSQFIFDGINWPLPQTNQMNLETILLNNPNDVNGVFCVTTSYRNEPNPIPGRHDKIFPMFEFEGKGSIQDLRNLENNLVKYLGFDAPKQIFYNEACNKYKIDVLESEHETQMQEDYGNSISLEYFPQRSHPFWNMKQDEYQNDLFHKIDVLLYGMETIGSAERSTNPVEMRNNFHSVSNGNYAKLLYSLFGQKRVIDELESYLSLPMFPRFGGGIGMTRLIRAINLNKGK